MKTMLIAIFIFAMQPSQTKDGKRATKAETAQSTQQTESTTGNNEKAQDPSVSVTVNANSPPNTEQGKKNDEENRQIQKRLVGFTGLLVLVGVATAAFVGWQSWETRKSARAANESVIAVKNQLPELKKSADAAHRSAETATQNIELYIGKERARLRVEMKPLVLPNEPDPAYTVDFSVSIYGPTDAFITESRCVAYAFPLQVMENPELGEAIMFPIHSLAAVVRANGDPLDCYAFLSLGDENVFIEEVRAKRFFVGIRGVIKYKDVFDRERETSFRYVWKSLDIYGLSPDCGEWVKNGKSEENRET